MIIRFTSPDEARKACAAAIGPVTLVSLPGAGAVLGSAWFLSLEKQLWAEFPHIRPGIIVDYGDAAGRAMAGLRQGVKRLVFTGAPEILEKLQSAARETGAEVLDSPPSIS